VRRLFNLRDNLHDNPHDNRRDHHADKERAADGANSTRDREAKAGKRGTGD